MNQSIGFPDLPMGFSMALAQNPQALSRFSELTDAQRQAVDVYKRQLWHCR